MPNDVKANILLVDDRQENLLALEAVLADLGQNLVMASSGEEALKWVLKEDFAVILLDVQMPGMSGLETARLIKQRAKSRTIPIIFLTAIDKDAPHVFQGYSVGAVDYLFKPFEPQILRSKVSVFVELSLKSQQLKRQADELSGQKQFNELILNTAGEGIFGVDAHGLITFINPAGASLLGYQIDELIGHPLHATLHHSHAAGEPYRDEDCPILRTLHEGIPQQRSDETFWRKDRSACPVDFTSTPIQQGRQTVGAVITFTDITARKQAEEAICRHIAELERAYQELRDNERYKDEFLSVISHELRTPINFIMGFSEILEDEVAGPLNARQHEYLRKVLDGSERILMLVNDLIDVATLTAGKFEIHAASTCYDDVVNEVISSLKPLAKQKNLSLQADLHAPHDVTIDGPRIAQVLNNLVTNAIKFTPAGGAITVNAFTQDHSLVTEVRDTGIGFCEEDIPKLFTSFRQLDMSTTRSVGGTGLGLNIAKALVEAHGGTLSAMSPGQNKGSVFTFTLPIASPRAEQPAASRTGMRD